MCCCLVGNIWDEYFNAEVRNSKHHKASVFCQENQQSEPQPQWDCSSSWALRWGNERYHQPANQHHSGRIPIASRLRTYGPPLQSLLHCYGTQPQPHHRTACVVGSGSRSVLQGVHEGFVKHTVEKCFFKTGKKCYFFILPLKPAVKQKTSKRLLDLCCRP